MKTEITYQAGVEILKNVLQLSYDTKLSYQHLIALTNDDSIVEWLELKVEHLSDFISDILSELDTMYIDPKLKSSLQARIERIGFKTKYSFFEIDTIAIINRSLKLDHTVYKYLADNINGGLYSKKIDTVLKDEMHLLQVMIQPNGYSQLQVV